MHRRSAALSWKRPPAPFLILVSTDTFVSADFLFFSLFVQKFFCYLFGGFFFTIFLLSIIFVDVYKHWQFSCALFFDVRCEESRPQKISQNLGQTKNVIHKSCSILGVRHTGMRIKLEWLNWHHVTLVASNLRTTPGTHAGDKRLDWESRSCTWGGMKISLSTPNTAACPWRGTKIPRGAAHWKGWKKPPRGHPRARSFAPTNARQLFAHKALSFTRMSRLVRWPRFFPKLAGREATLKILHERGARG